MVFDTLFGIDEHFIVQPRMADGYVIEDDGKRWIITLREGLRFHDGEPVLARDVVPSVKRFCARDNFGRALMAATDEIMADGDRRIVFRLKKPFRHLALALAGSTSGMPGIMPARLAETDPFKLITEMVGGSPFKFVAPERIAGHRVVYEKSKGYTPRPKGESSFLSCPKIVNFDRVEWTIIPDPATTAAALRSGGIDMWETVVSDFLPILKADRNIQVGSNKLLTAIGFTRFNHLYPPFEVPRSVAHCCP